jgi:multimeric flavodoxin WrbA
MRTPKITAVTGTYRKGGIVASAGDELLDSAREAGAICPKIYLLDRHLEFCTNCRSCWEENSQPEIMF